jgi:hypothetical protein
VEHHVEIDPVRGFLVDLIVDSAAKLPTRMLILEAQNLSTLSRIPKPTRPFLNREKQ